MVVLSNCVAVYAPLLHSLQFLAVQRLFDQQIGRCGEAAHAGFAPCLMNAWLHGTSVRSGRLVGWWVYQRKVCVHASKSGNRKVSYRQKRVKKDEEQSGVIRQLVGRRGIFSQTKGRKQHLAAAWWGSPLMSASCLHHTDEVMISRPPRQRTFFSSAAAETKCVGACIMLSRSIDRQCSRAVLSNA